MAMILKLFWLSEAKSILGEYLFSAFIISSDKSSTASLANFLIAELALLINPVMIPCGL